MTTAALSNRACHPVFHEIRDDNGVWHSGWLPFTRLAETVGTTVPDLMRRLAMLGIVERDGLRHRVTPGARRKGYGTTYRHSVGGKKRIALDVILPEGMVYLVRNLEETNAPLSEAEKLVREGMSQRAIAERLGITQQAVQKRLASVPPRLKDWPMLGEWGDDVAADNDNSDNQSVAAS